MIEYKLFLFFISRVPNFSYVYKPSPNPECQKGDKK